jgi:hypothetical protein
MPTTIRLRCALLLLAIGSLSAGCEFLTGPYGDYPAPPETGDGWVTATPEQVGMGSDSLVALVNFINSTEEHLIHSILIVREQRLVFEEYWPGTRPSTT